MTDMVIYGWLWSGVAVWEVVSARLLWMGGRAGLARGRSGVGRLLVLVCVGNKKGE